MQDKIENLRELAELYQSKNISLEEYEKLKGELLNDDSKLHMTSRQARNTSNEPQQRKPNTFTNKSEFGIIALVIVIAIIVISLFSNDSNNGHSSPSESNSIPSKVEENNSTNSINDNNGSSNDEKGLNISSYLKTHTFNINGNGLVEFVNNEIIVQGGNATIHGNYNVTGVKSARIANYQATDGSFDASNNRAASGSLILNSDGTLSLFLSDGDNNRNYTLSPN